MAITVFIVTQRSVSQTGTLALSVISERFNTDELHVGVQQKVVWCWGNVVLSFVSRVARHDPNVLDVLQQVSSYQSMHDLLSRPNPFRAAESGFESIAIVGTDQNDVSGLDIVTQVIGH